MSYMSRVAAGQLVLHRARRLRWIAILAGLLLLLPSGQTAVTLQFRGLALSMAIVVLGAYASYRGLAAYFRAEAARERELFDAARHEGAVLAANTVRHHIGNKLAVTVGYSELLADDPRLPPDVQADAHRIMTTALAAAEVVHRLEQRLIRLQVDARLAGPPVLDIDASTGSEPQPNLNAIR
jgi:hypothetical protein